MEQLILACIAFIAIHILISGTPIRGVLVGLISEMGFMALFSLLSIAALVWIVMAYGAFEGVLLWDPWPGSEMVMPYLMLIVVFFVVAGAVAPNPTAMGKEGVLDDGTEPSGILRITRHPMMWGFILWGAFHLYRTGLDKTVLVSVTIMITAWVGTSMIDRKRAAAHGDKWIHFAALTSVTPFAAIIEGRNSLKLGEIKWWIYVATFVVWAGISWLHAWLGVPTGLI